MTLTSLSGFESQNQGNTSLTPKNIYPAIRGAEMSNNQKEALRFILREWGKHQNTTGVIFFGADKMAEQCKLSVRTAKRFLGVFRESGWIEAVKYPRGGACATRYVVHLDAMKRDLSKGGAA